MSGQNDATYAKLARARMECVHRETASLAPYEPLSRVYSRRAPRYSFMAEPGLWLFEDDERERGAVGCDMDGTGLEEQQQQQQRDRVCRSCPLLFAPRLAR